MEAMTVRRPPDRFLIHDEVETFKVKREQVPYRIRLWRGANLYPVALVSHIADECLWPGPSAITVKLANYVRVSLLNHSEPIMGYYEDEHLWSTNERSMSQVAFDRFGYGLRSLLHKPERDMRPWSLLEHILRQKIER